MSDKIYKIRRKSDGLFSDGGSWPTFKTNGKAYRTLTAITNWVENKSFPGDRIRFDDCEIVEFEIVEKRIIPINV